MARDIISLIIDFVYLENAVAAKVTAVAAHAAFAEGARTLLRRPIAPSERLLLPLTWTMMFLSSPILGAVS